MDDLTKLKAAFSLIVIGLYEKERQKKELEKAEKAREKAEKGKSAPETPAVREVQSEVPQI